MKLRYHRFSTIRQLYLSKQTDPATTTIYGQNSYDKIVTEVRFRDADNLGVLHQVINSLNGGDIISIRSADRVTSNLDLVPVFLDLMYDRGLYLEIDIVRPTIRLKYYSHSDPVRVYRDAMAFAKQIHIGSHMLHKIRLRKHYATLCAQIEEARIKYKDWRYRYKQVLLDYDRITPYYFRHFISESGKYRHSLPPHPVIPAVPKFKNPIDETKFNSIRNQ